MREKIKYYPITQGHIIATWQIVLLVSRYKAISPRSVISITGQSGSLGGTLPGRQGLRICLDYGLLSIKSGVLHLTELAELKIIPFCNEEDPNHKVLRAIIFHLISYHNFQWLIFYDPDPEIFREYLLGCDPEWVNLLDNAKLFDFSDQDVIVWWDKVLVKYETYKDKIKKEIGDVGEKLTYDYELTRIEIDGYIPSKLFVKWAARLSDRFGYDILSIRGKFFSKLNNEKEQIQIEVKSSDSFNIQRFKFHISKPEWKTAVNNLNSYFFFCWPGVNIENETAIDGPFVIPAFELLDHVPKDNSENCEWSECRCIMDISRYRI